VLVDANIRSFYYSKVDRCPVILTILFLDWRLQDEAVTDTSGFRSWRSVYELAIWHKPSRSLHSSGGLNVCVNKFEDSRHSAILLDYLDEIATRNLRKE
jgi:hypothetical protein